MSTHTPNSNFFSAHYDWVVLILSLLALAAAGVMAFRSLGENPEEKASEAVQRFDRVRSDAQTEVKGVDLKDYESALALLRKPPVIPGLPEKGEHCFAGECRVFCPNCRGAMPLTAATCPNCGKAPKEEIVVVVDADGDGIPSDWESAHGMDPRDASDADKDLDGDGFTNMEEYRDGTDPQNPTSHLPYLDFLKLQAPLKQTTLPFFFVRAMKTPAGTRLYFTDPKKRNDYGTRGFNYSVLLGEAIGDTGFVAKEYKEQSEEVVIKGGGGSKKDVDTSFAVIERTKDKKRLALSKDERNKAVDLMAVLQYSRTGQSFTVAIGDTFELNLGKYRVVDISRKGKTAKVKVEGVNRGEVRDLEALEP